MKYKLAYLIATGMRYDDAFILQEIIKYHYKSNFLIIHSVFDPFDLYTPYLEDVVIKHHENIHQLGSWLSINQTIHKAYCLGCDYAVFTHADTWFLSERILLTWINALIEGESIMVNTHSYKYKTLSTDCFLIDLKRAVEENYFPHSFPDWIESDEEMYMLMESRTGGINKNIINLEPRQLWMQDKKKYCNREECIPLQLVGHHYPQPKKQRIREYGISANIGKHTKRLLTSEFLSYYNLKHRTSYQPYV